MSFRRDAVAILVIAVACGVLSTARIMLASLDAFGQPIHALDNCYFLLPLLRYRGQPDASRERLHTLAQVFIEMVDPASSTADWICADGTGVQ